MAGIIIKSILFENTAENITVDDLYLTEPSPEKTWNLKCTFSSDCYEYLKLKGFGDKLLDAKGFRCFCSDCFQFTVTEKTNDGEKVRKPLTHYKQGKEDYVIPLGWTRFGLRVGHMIDVCNDIWKRWANSFHGAPSKAAISIINHQSIALKGDMLRKGDDLASRASIEHRELWFVTPVPDYASHKWYSAIEEFKTKKGKKLYGQVVLAMKVRTYTPLEKAGDVSVMTIKKQGESEDGYKKGLDNYECISESEVEWYSLRRGCTYPYGVLVRIFDEDTKREIEKLNNKK